MVSSANHENHRWLGRRPGRVSHNVTTANSTGMAKSPIMIRNAQYVTNKLGR